MGSNLNLQMKIYFYLPITTYYFMICCENSISLVKTSFFWGEGGKEYRLLNMRYYHNTFITNYRL